MTEPSAPMTGQPTAGRPTAERRFPLFWILAGIAACAGLLLPFLQPEWSAERLAVIVAAETALACLVLWLYDRARFALAGRAVFLLIFLAYAKHMLDEVAGDRPAREAIFGFVILGLPALGYALFGRFAPKPPPASPRSREMATPEGADSEVSRVADPPRPSSGRD